MIAVSVLISAPPVAAQVETYATIDERGIPNKMNSLSEVMSILGKVFSRIK
jgi:hypothetical protein